MLSELPDDALSLTGWNPDWSVGKLANHIVFAQARMIGRATGEVAKDEPEMPSTAEGMKALARKALENDLKVRELLDFENQLMTFSRLGVEVQHMRATIVAQIVHHSTEHRTQISDILAMNKMDLINLDTMDLWSFESSKNQKRLTNLF